MNDKLIEAMVAVGAIDSDALNKQMKVAIGSIKLIKKYAEEYGKDKWYEDFVKQIKELL